MKILKNLQEYGSLVITVLIGLILGAMMFVLIGGTDDWRDPQLWIQAGFNTLLQIIIVITWIPEGRKRGCQDATYIANKNAANCKMQDAGKAENLDRLTAFCEEMTQENVNAWIAKRVARYGVVYSSWNAEKYRCQFDDKTAQKVRKAELRAVRKVKEIKATEVVTNSDTELIYDTKDHTDSTAKLKVMFKIMSSVLLCVVGAFISLDGVAFTVAALVKFFYWILIMCMSIFYAVRTGFQLITLERNDYYKRLIVFLTRFEAWKDDTCAADTALDVSAAEKTAAC